MPSRVAIDCRSLQDRPLGGVGRSVQGQLRDLASALPVDALIDSRMPEPIGLPPGMPVHSLRGPLTARGFAWLQVAAPRWLRDFDGLFHCPFYGLPYRQPVPMVVTIHDLSFEFAPQWFPKANRIAFQLQARHAARTARRILVHSDHVGSMVLDLYGSYGVRAEQIIRARMPVNPRFSRPAPGWEAIPERFGLRDRYVVALGGARRRRLNVAVAAWQHACQMLDTVPTDLPLAVVGTERPPPAPGIVYLGAINDADWAAVLRGAAAFCYATAYEGYGMPATEAAASGTPIVCYRVGSLPEILGGGAAWSANHSASELGAALARVLRDEGLADSLRSTGLASVKALPADWSGVAAATLRAYRESCDA